jgi:hypothetical protein
MLSINRPSGLRLQSFVQRLGIIDDGVNMPVVSCMLVSCMWVFLE